MDSGPDEGMVYPLSESVTTLGRGPSNTIQLSDKRSSRFHAEVVRRGSSFRLRDLNSKNGTRVQGVRIAEEYTLRHGDQIRIGQAAFVFEDADQAAAGEGAKRAAGTSAIRLMDAPPTRMHGSAPAGATSFKEPVEPGQTPQSSESQRKLRVLLQVVEKVRSVLELGQLLREVLELVFEIFKPERGVILMLDPKTNTLLPRAVKTSDADDISISRTIVQQVINDRMSLLISDAVADQRFHGVESIVAQHIRSSMCAPLFAQNTVFGVLYIDSLSYKVDYSQADLELLTAITDQAALAISNALLHQSLLEQNRLEHELEIARSIQMNLLPRRPPIVPGFEISAISLPAKRVGGDYYDFMEIDSDRLGVAVADVSGKGVAAAILTASVRAALQVEASTRETRIETMIANLNEMACRDTANDMFISLFFGVLQLSSRRLRYVNAGHCHPFVVTADGKETFLDKGGCVLGVMPGRRFEQGEIRLEPRSTLVIYSDGVTDVFNEKGEAFGAERLRRIVAESTDATALALREKLTQVTTAHRGKIEQFDDYTLVIIKVL